MRPAAVLFLFAASACAQIAASYTGTWTSAASGNGGDLRIALTGDNTAGWHAKSSFTIQGQEVKTTEVSVKIAGDQVVLVFEYDIQGMTLRSTMSGTLTGNTVKGKYVSADTGGQPVDEGTWTASRP